MRRISGLAVAGLSTVAALAAASGCGGGGRGGGGGEGPGRIRPAGAPLVLVAGMTPLDPVPGAEGIPGVDLERLGVDRVDAVYDLTTPAGEAFTFDAVSRASGNQGTVFVSLAHAAEEGNAPAGGAESLARAGMVPSATGAVGRPPWVDAVGDGFSRITLRGSVDREQVLALRSEAGRRETTALVRIRIGPRSAVNLAALPGGDYPGVVEEATLYSSDSWSFGLPSASVSGDRTTVVVYEGDRADPLRYDRYEMRLQHDRLTGLVTGGAAEETSPDSGNWRDHETAALYNVLALVRGGESAVELKLSFDRGATFGQSERFPTATGETGPYRPRLVRAALALDYTVGVAFWRSTRDGGSELVLLLGRPSAFDGAGSPTAFSFEPARVLHRDAGDVTPLPLGMAWSAGGDLVVGYGFTRFTSNRDGTWTSLTQNRCAVLPFGGEIRDALVEEEAIVGRDPSVAVLGSGQGMRVFFAYEAADGIRLRTSADAGRSFGPPAVAGQPGSMEPRVLARDRTGTARVDLLFLAQAPEGTEIHLRHWDDFDAGTWSDHRLTRAETFPSADADPGDRVPGAGFAAPLPTEGWRTRQVAWMGYDAVLDGDGVVVVYDEVTYDAWTFLAGGWFDDGRVVTLGGAGPEVGSGEFTPAEPPPLAPGLTDPVPAPDPGHMHQLRRIRFD